MNEIQSTTSILPSAKGIPSFQAALSPRPVRVDSRAGSDLVIWVERYVQACGVTDPVKRGRLIRLVLDTSAIDASTQTGMGQARAADLQRQVDGVLLASHGAWAVSVVENRGVLYWGRLLLRNGTDMEACGCTPERYAVPPSQPTDMPTQDLSAWSPRESLRRFVRPRMLHLSVTAAVAVLAAVFVGR